jgi:signal transduction histidine kinase
MADINLYQAIYGLPDLRYADYMDHIGLLTQDELNKTHTNIGVELDYATTLVFRDQNGVLQKDDSKLIDKTTCAMCKAFRSWTNEEYCKRSYYKHVGLLIGKKYSKITPEVLSGDGCTVETWEMSAEYAAQYDAYKGTTQRCIAVSYICPYLPYREYMFPIAIDDVIIAVMFIGQVPLKSGAGNSEKEIRGKFRALLDDSKISFEDSMSQKKKADLITKGYNAIEKRADFIIDSIVASDITDVQRFQRNFEITPFMPVYNHIIRLINGLEEELRLKCTMRRKDAIREAFDRIKHEVFNDLNKVNSADDKNKLSVFWEVIEERTKQLFDDIQIGQLCAYGNKDYTNGVLLAPIRLKKMFHVDLDCTPSVGFQKNITFNPKVLGKGYPFIADEGQIRSCFPYINASQTTLFVWPAYDETCYIVFTLRLVSLRNETIEKEILPFVLDNILNLYALLFSEYQSIWALIAKEVAVAERNKTEQAFAILSHEIAQHTSSLTGLYSNYFNSVDSIRKLANTKLEDVTSDFYSCMEMLDYLSQNSKIYSGKIRPEPSSFLAFSEIIFKFRSIFRRLMKDKQISMLLPKISYSDRRRGELYTDKILFEQILFNILRNAVQYAYPFTYIYVDCIKADEKLETPHKLTVTNYGIKLDDTVDIFAMGERGKEAESYCGRGTGIGLYIVKRIVEALGGDIHAKSVLIYKYNLPLVRPYLDMLEAGREDRLGIKPELESINEKRRARGKQIVAPGSFNLLFRQEIKSINELNIEPSEKENLREDIVFNFTEDNITMETFETTFEITIPPYKKEGDYNE